MKRPSALTRRSKVTMLPAKTCNICGSDSVVYIVMDNGILCSDCVPIESQSIKEIPNESNMIKKVVKNKTL